MHVSGVQLYKNNARALLSRILSIVNSDCLLRAQSLCGVYECLLVSKILATAQHDAKIISFYTLNYADLHIIISVQGRYKNIIQ